jgi:putative aldouronate transport system permease protein
MKRSPGERIFDISNAVFLGIFGIVTLYPFWNVICTSLVGQNEFYNSTILLWPRKIIINAYQYIFSTDWIWSGFKTSITVTVFGTLFTMFLVCTAAYVLSTKRQLPGKKILVAYFLITMYFSGGIIPYYLVVVKYLPLYNSLLALIITNGLNVWGFLVLRTFFREIPAELPESAKMDGANEFTILLKVIIPLSLPALATLTLFNAVAHWNEWSRALYFIEDEHKLPIQMVLRKMVIDLNSSQSMRSDMDKAYQQLVGGESKVFIEAVKAATITVATMPIVLIYPFLQKYFVKGVMIGSVKG